MNDKSKVLLIYPGSKAWGVSYPIGLLYVAQALQKAGIEVSLLHLGTGTLDDLKYDDYLFVGITMMVGEMIGKGLEAAKLIKKYNPSIPIVLGGVYPSILPEQVLKNPLIDIAVIGEGEVTVVELAAALKGKGDLPEIKGLAYRSGGKIVINAPREFLDMESLDLDLPYHLLGDSFARSAVVPVHTSRGCPYRCGFCYSPGFNKRKYRCKSARKVVDEIEFLVNKYNIRNFNFDYEDEFFVNPERAMEIFKAVLLRGLEIRWTAFCRFDSFCSAYARYGEDFLKLLKDSGCFYLSFGAESGSQRLLDEVIKKDITIGQIYTTVDALKKTGIIHRIYFMNCIPGETNEDLEATLNVIDRISESNRYIVFVLFHLAPMPKTALMELLQKEYNFIPPSTMEEWGDYLPVKQSRVTWCTKDHAALCFDISRMAPVAFHQDFDSYGSYKSYLETSGRTYISGYFAYLVTKIQRFRYKRRLFRYNFEMLLLTGTMRAYAITRNFLINSVLKRCLPVALHAVLKRMLGQNDWASGRWPKPSMRNTKSTERC